MNGAAPRGRCLGIAVATQQEARALFPYATPFLQAPPDHDRILLDITGIGPAAAAAGAQRLLAGGATALLSWGSAAGLDPALTPGTLLLPRAVIGPDGELPASPAWHDTLRLRLSPQMDVVTGPLAHSAEILRHAAQKHALYRRTGAAAADMESAVLGRAAADAGIPFLVLRAVADPADGFLPGCVTDAVDPSGRLQLGRLLRGLVRRPWQAVGLMRLARWFGAAEQRLRRAAALQAPSSFAAFAPPADEQETSTSAPP